MWKGIRGKRFSDFIASILEMGKIPTEVISKISTHEMYAQCFTHASASSNNYEMMEFLGDSLLNKCIVDYISKRFPQFVQPEGVPILARMKINLVSSKVFSGIGRELGMLPFISIAENIRETDSEKTLEDVFEAFFGATETLLNHHVCFGYGYVSCFQIISALLDRIEISTRYTDLYDSKTILKEIFDDKSLGKIIYTTKFQEDRMENRTVIEIERDGGREMIGEGRAFTKIKSEQIAAKAALNALAKMGIRKKLSPVYAKLGILY